MNGDQQEFKIGEDEEPAVVEMNDDGSNAVVTTMEESPLVEVEQQGAKPKKDELDQYSDKVQRRIDKLTSRLRETQRREEAAIEYARSVQSKADDLERRFQQTDVERLSEAKGRVETQVVALKQIIKKAREEYDIDTETEAQQRLTGMMMDQQRISEATAYRQQVMAQQPPTQPYAAPQQQQRQRVDPQAEEWAERNAWFGTNPTMTGAVRGIHLDLVQKEGFDPQSEEYYDEIDRRMRDIFPKELKVAPTQQNNRNNRPVQTVAPATRSSGVNSSARRTVRLNPSQVAIAKRLGVPLEEYAKYVKE